MLIHMGAVQYGLWILLSIFSVEGYLSLLDLNMQTSVVRYLTKYVTKNQIEEYKKLLITAFVIFFGLGVFLFFITFLFSQFSFLNIFNVPQTFQEEMQFCLVLVSLGYLFQFPAKVLIAFYMSINNFFVIRLWEVLNTLLFGIIVFFLLPYKNGITGIFLAQIGVSFMLFLVFLIFPLFYYKNIFSLNIKKCSFEGLNPVLSMSFYSFISGIYYVTLYRGPEVLVGIFLSPVYLTYYTIIIKIPRILKTVVSFLNSVVLPTAVSLDLGEMNDQLKFLYLRGTRYTFFVTTPLFVFILFYSQEILTLWVGEAYSFLSHYFLFYAVWQMGLFFTSFGVAMYTRTSDFKSIMPYGVLGIFLFFIINIYWIAEWKLDAILCALFLSAFVGIVFNFRLLYKKFSFTLGEYFNYVLKYPILVIFSVTSLLLFVSKLVIHEVSIPSFLLICIVTFIVNVFIVFKWGLLESEKKELCNLSSQKCYPTPLP